MKLTWFGGTTIRIHIGGAILVVDPAGAPTGIDPAELVSGADLVIHAFGASLAPVTGTTWKPRAPLRLLDEGDTLPQVEAFSLGAGAIVIDAIGEAPLVLARDAMPPLGRWAEAAVVTVFASHGLADIARAALEQRPPRLLALASTEAEVDRAIDVLRPMLDGTGLVALEAGLALEA